jgi:hypothetical protein
VRAKLTYSEAGHQAEYNPVRGGVGFLRPSGHQAITCPKLREVVNTVQGIFLLCLFPFFIEKTKTKRFVFRKFFKSLCREKPKKLWKFFNCANI